MRRKPIVVVALVGFWLGYVALCVFQYWNDVSEVVDQDNVRRLQHLDYQVYMASPLLAAGEIDSLKENLEMVRTSREFDFYIIKQNDAVLDFYNPQFSLEETNRSEFPLGPWQSADGLVRGRTIKVRDYTFAMGINTRGSEYVLRILNYYKWMLARDFVLVTLFFGLLIFFVLKDILDLARVLRSKDRRFADLIKIRTQEAETILAVTNQFERVNETLKLSNQTYSESISPAVKYELSQDTPVPHLFPAIVVRIDVNGYTQMFLERKDKFVTDTLNRYFRMASEIVGRYGGHIYQFVGDEMVFHFKELDDPESRELAMSCVRSLFEVAEDMDTDLRPQGVPFVVKASMARGRLRFIRLDTGYAFAGLPLIESVRMLGKIEEREHNVLALYAEDYKAVESFAPVYKRSQVEFKGFYKQTEIVEIKEFNNLKRVLDQRYYSQLKYHRSDGDLCAIMRHVGERLNRVTKEEFLEVYKILRAMNIERVNGLVVETFSGLFVTVDSWASADQKSELRNFLIASMTNVAAKLLQSGAMNEVVRKRMERNLEHPDQRVRGNTILALDELSPETYSFKEMFSLPYNRAAADALVAEGRRDYSQEVHRFLKSFLISPDPFFVASGLYVCAFLYNFHRERDSVYFKANSWLQEIPRLIQSCREHQDPMVRRRAQISHSIIEEIRAA